MDFKPNKRADVEAKAAAQGNLSSPKDLSAYLRQKPLPTSIPALRQAHLEALRKHWKQRWKTSPRYKHTKAINNSLPSNKYLRLIDKLDRCQSAIITQLCTGHIPLTITSSGFATRKHPRALIAKASQSKLSAITY
jgi:hypothetical protein